MDWSIVIGVIIAVGVLGTIAAISWWRLANKAAPYEKPRGGAGRGSPSDVVIIREERGPDARK